MNERERQRETELTNSHDGYAMRVGGKRREVEKQGEKKGRKIGN